MKLTDLDIVSLPTEIDRNKIDSRYRLIVMAAQRARFVAQGGRGLVDGGAIKPTTQALQDAISGKLEFLVGDEARAASEEARLMEARRAQEEAKRREEMGVELSELEKDLKIYLHGKENEQRQELDALFSGEQESAPAGEKTTDKPEEPEA